MDSFEELGLRPELTEALASEGIEAPTPLQESAVPVVRRANNLVATAGPGAGTLLAYGAGLLDRLEPRDPHPTHAGPEALILVPFARAAQSLAESLARIGSITGHPVAALGGTWGLPRHAQLLFATPGEALAAIQHDDLSLDDVTALVLDGAATLEAVAGWETIGTLLEYVPGEAQRVVLSLPRTTGVDEFVEHHVKRSVHVPPRAVGDPEAVPARGHLQYRIVEDRFSSAIELLAERLSEDTVRHVVVFVRSEDRAADLGDEATLRGFRAGEPGDEGVPLWLGVNALEVRSRIEDRQDVAVISVDVPSGPDALDRRHGAGKGGHVLVLPRELAHLKDVAARTGYLLDPDPRPREIGAGGDLDELLAKIASAIGEEDIAVYLGALDGLFQNHDPAEVAAAALALLRRRGVKASADVTAPTAKATAWVRLYVSVGRKDQAGPGDIVGAIAGESGVDASRIGRIELKDSFSVVEVESEVAERVIKAVNGTTVKGRSVRVDYDRGGRRVESGRGKKGGSGRPRPPAGRRS